MEGSIVLRWEEGSPKTLTLFGGKTMKVADKDKGKDYGNVGITASTTYLVECTRKEAIGIALACGCNNIPISVKQ